ncbi:PIN domain-containing protein [candidate division WWE3 bacterium]|nr:PIN domain-containing protein [candidate division WWE3 bacterium]
MANNSVVSSRSVGKKILADTSVLIGLQRNDKEVASIFYKLADSVQISRISACELIFGSRNKKEKNINKTFLSNFPIVEIDADTSQYAYILLDKYGLKNKFGIADSLIAGTAVVNDLALWTDNTKHFQIIKGLTFYEA